MKFKTIVLLAFAVGCGLVAMLGVQQLLADRSAADKANKVKVLVAAVDILPGTPLDETNTTTKEWPKDLVPENAVTSKSQYEERAIKTGAVTGEMILTTKLTEKGQFGASAAIPVGMRVVTIPVNETKTHSGMLMPTDRVDIIVTYKTQVQGIGNVSKTKTLLEYIEVFAADNQRSAEQADTKDVKAKNISLLVTPQQAEIIKLASDKGQLDLILRGKGDSEFVANNGIDESLLEELSSGLNAAPKPEASSSPEPAPVTIATQHNIQSFLGGFEYPGEKVKAPVVEEPAAVQLPEPEPVPTWKVQIYSGEDLIEQQFPLPEDASEQARKTATLQVTALNSTYTPVKTSKLVPSGNVQDQVLATQAPVTNGEKKPADMGDFIKSLWGQPTPPPAPVSNPKAEQDLDKLLSGGLSF